MTREDLIPITLEMERLSRQVLAAVEGNEEHPVFTEAAITTGVIQYYTRAVNMDLVNERLALKIIKSLVEIQTEEFKRYL